jgi:hypothetical protein
MAISLILHSDKEKMDGLYKLPRLPVFHVISLTAIFKMKAFTILSVVAFFTAVLAAPEYKNQQSHDARIAGASNTWVT